VEAVAATESDNWRIDQAVAEYEALRAGELHVLAGSTDAQGGAIEYCGTESDAAHWTIAYVRAEDEALLPLAVGPFERAIKSFTRLDRTDTPIWDPRLFPPPVAVVDGARRHFRPARGRYLVGVVEAERRAVLLVALGEALAVVHVAGQERMVLFRGGPFGFRDLDVDGLVRAHAGAGEPADASSVVRLSPSIRDHHARIVGKLHVEVGEGPTLGEVLRVCFEDLGRRAASVKRQDKKQKRKGKTMVMPVVRALYRAILVGCGNFEGTAGELLEQLKGLCPELEISAEAFANVLRLLRATGTCVVRHPSRRSWRLCLVGLTDPRSPLHRQLCKETIGVCRLPDNEAQASAPIMPPPAPPPRAQEPSSAPPTPELRPADELRPEPVASSSPVGEPAAEDAQVVEALVKPGQAPESTQAIELEDRAVAGLSAPAAGVAVFCLAARAASQSEAIARATWQVEREELLARLAVAEAERVRLAAPARRQDPQRPDASTPSARGACRRDRPASRLPLLSGGEAPHAEPPRPQLPSENASRNTSSPARAPPPPER
jgi:hypothetical protein